MMNYRNEVTPFSTQHGTKGAEYDDVIVVLDNGNWMQYNLESALTHNSNNKKDSVYARSLNILYVSLSRARNNLVVFMMNPDATVLNTACNIFGKSNVVKF